MNFQEARQSRHPLYLGFSFPSGEALAAAFPTAARRYVERFGRMPAAVVVHTTAPDLDAGGVPIHREPWINPTCLYFEVNGGVPHATTD